MQISYYSVSVNPVLSLSWLCRAFCGNCESCSPVPCLSGPNQEQSESPPVARHIFQAKLRGKCDGLPMALVFVLSPLVYTLSQEFHVCQRYLFGIPTHLTPLRTGLSLPAAQSIVIVFIVSRGKMTAEETLSFLEDDHLCGRSSGTAQQQMFLLEASYCSVHGCLLWHRAPAPSHMGLAGAGWM